MYWRFLSLYCRVSRKFTIYASYGTVILLLIAVIVVAILSAVPKEVAVDCRYPSPPYSIWFTKYFDDEGRVSWNTDWIHTECETTFMLRYNYNGRTWYDSTSEDFVIVSDLYMCSRLEVRLWAVNKWGERSPHYTENWFLVIPEEQSITDLTPYEIVDGILFSWSKPTNLTQCDVTYSIKYISELGSWTTRTADTQVLIPNDNYCFHFAILINVYVYSVFNSVISYEYKTELKIEGQKIQISPTDPAEFIVTWDSNAKEELCLIKYIVAYDTVNATESQVITTPTPKANFRFVYCEEAWLSTRITIVNGDTITPSNSIVAATQYPEDITHIGIVDFDSLSSKDMMIISWRTWQIDGSANYCRVRYQAEIITDFDTHIYPNARSPIEFSKGLYCFHLSLDFEFFVGGVSLGKYGAITDTTDLDPVKDLNLTKSAEPNTLIATWTDVERKVQCGIEYEITYGYDSIYETLRTNQSSLTFETAYCTTAFIRVRAISGSRESEMRSITYTEEC